MEIETRKLDTLSFSFRRPKLLKTVNKFQVVFQQTIGAYKCDLPSQSSCQTGEFLKVRLDLSKLIPKERRIVVGCQTPSFIVLHSSNQIKTSKYSNDKRWQNTATKLILRVITAALSQHAIVWTHQKRAYTSLEQYDHSLTSPCESTLVCYHSTSCVYLQRPTVCIKAWYCQK